MPFEMPEFVSLLQAALWATRGRQPIPEEIFEAARVELRPGEIEADGLLGEMVYLLRAGRIESKAGAAYYSVKPDLIISIQDVPYRPVAQHHWRFENIIWNESALRYNSWEINSAGHLLDFPQQFFEDVDARSAIEKKIFCNERKFIYEPVFIKCNDFMRYMSPLAGRILDVESGEHNTIKTGPKIGRPASYDWDAFYVELIWYIHEQGLPATQAELRNYIADWCQTRWGAGRVPSETVLKQKISPVFRRLREVGK